MLIEAEHRQVKRIAAVGRSPQVNACRHGSPPLRRTWPERQVKHEPRSLRRGCALKEAKGLGHHMRAGQDQIIGNQDTQASRFKVRRRHRPLG
jgi:hypothetical protein